MSCYFHSAMSSDQILDFFLPIWTLFVGLYVAAYFLDLFHNQGCFLRHRKTCRMELQHPRTMTQTFPKFSELSEDLMLNILCFVADAPLEWNESNLPSSTLTGIFPVVSKQFYRFSKSDVLWGSALKRLRIKDPSLWEEGLLRLLPHETKAGEDIENELRKLLDLDYLQIFRRVFEQHIRYTGPVFYMTGVVRLGHTFGLHFFEPRYRLLIAEVMRGWPELARHGATIVARADGRFPTFVYAHVAPLAPGTPACLVQVRQCVIHRDGSADVLLVPVSYVWLERIWERPHSGRLFEAQCLKMGREQARSMEAHRGENFMESEFLRFIAHHGGLENPSRGTMHAMLSYFLSGRSMPVHSDSEDEDGNEELQQEDGGEANEQEIQDRRF